MSADPPLVDVSSGVRRTMERVSTLIAAEDFPEALAECDESLRRGIESPDLHAQRARALQALGRHDEARAALTQARASRADDPDLARALGDLLVGAYRDYARAEPLFRHAVALDPDDMASHFGLAECRLQQATFAEARSGLVDALSGSAARALLEAMVVQLCNHGRYPEARTAAAQLLEARAGTPAAHLALARIADEAEHDYQLARRHLEAALQMFPGDTLCHLASIAHSAKIGEWRDASALAAAMLERFAYAYPRFGGGLRNWDGSSPAGTTVLLDSSIANGYGDAIHFCRFARQLKERGATVGIRARKSLRSLLATVPGVDFVIGCAEPAGHVDHACEMSLAWVSLGLAMDEVSRGVPYLSASRRDIAEWSARLGPRTSFRVGLAWLTADRRTANPYIAKNVPVPCLAPFAGLEGVRLFSLQTVSAGDELGPVFGAGTVSEYGPRLSDFMQTAALVDQLDAVVTADTAVAHLAGALGKPAFLLLPFSAEWRWLVERSDTPWYPTMRLFRQPAPGDWTSVTKACAHAIRELVRSTPGPVPSASGS